MVSIEGRYLLVIQIYLFLSVLAQFDAIGPIDFMCNNTNFLLYRGIQIVQVTEAVLVRIAYVNNCVGKFKSTLSALTPVERRNGGICTGLESGNSNSFKFGVGIGPMRSEKTVAYMYTNLFMATTTGTPNLTAFCICCAILTQPARTNSTFSVRYTSGIGKPGVTYW